MGFGLDLDIKVEMPKADVASQVGSVVDTAKQAVAQVVGGVTAAVDKAGQAVATAASALAGAVAEVAEVWTGPVEDLVLEPHLILDANASYGETHFDKGPVWILVDLSPDEAKDCDDRLRLFSSASDYDTTKDIRDFADANGDTVAILFTDVPMSCRYSLEVLGEGMEPLLLVENVPYGELRKTSRRFLGANSGGEAAR